MFFVSTALISLTASFILPSPDMERARKALVSAAKIWVRHYNYLPAWFSLFSRSLSAMVMLLAYIFSS